MPFSSLEYAESKVEDLCKEGSTQPRWWTEPSKGRQKSFLDTMPSTIGPILGYQTSGNWTSSKSFRLIPSRQLSPNTSIKDDLRKLIITTHASSRIGNRLSSSSRGSLNTVQLTAEAEKPTQKRQAKAEKDF
uniref:Uncharacterized protein n=1 Tax=Micrurus carvalhoi TaxID=3147026 RepID=A0A2H6N758_9SAUR